VPPLLAREAVTAAALSGDAAVVLAAHEALAGSDSARYDRRRAAAFVAALAGDRSRALRELGVGAGARSLRLGVDTAVVELLTRGPGQALEALRAALRDGVHSEPDVPLVLAECVRRAPDSARAALVVAVSGGTWAERVLAAAAVLRAARPTPAAAVPAVVAVSLAVVVVAFVRLPTPDAEAPSVAPTLRERPESGVVAEPSRPRQATSPRADRLQRRLDLGANTLTARERVVGARSTAAAAPTQHAAFPARLRTPSPPAPKPAPAPAPPRPAAAAASEPPAAAQAPTPAPAEAPAPQTTPPARTKEELKAARKAAKAQQKAEHKAEQKAEKAPANGDASPPAPAPPAAAPREPEPQGPPPAAEHGREDKPERPEKSK
jgi:hypothetical protein